MTFAVPTLSQAASQADWLERQLQITDGYAPSPVLPAPGVGHANAPTVRPGGLSASHALRPAPRQRAAFRHPANSHEAPASREVFADREVFVDREVFAHREDPPVRDECVECAVIEARPEVDVPREGIGLAAVALLLAFAGFKVVNQNAATGTLRTL